MAGEGGATEPRRVLIKYLRQVQELGEDEVYLSEDVREMLSGAPTERPEAPRAPAQRVATAKSSDTRGQPRHGAEDPIPGPARRGTGSPPSGAPRRTGKPGSSGSSRSDASRLAASMPEPEVVEIRLAVSGTSGTGDMFAATTDVDACRSLEEVEKIALSCEKCELAQGRTKVVFGTGNPNAILMFIGEAPGRDEDLSGVPFVGRAGQLLDKILEAADISRDEVYIGNVIKCRPPNNRTPLTSEIDACMPYLAKQLACIRPRIICTLGLPATQTLLGLKGSMASMRGKLYRAGDTAVVPTYHPAAALRDPRYKKPIWEDFLLLKREYDRTRK